MHGHFAVLNSSRFFESSKYFQTLIFFLEILQIGNCLHRQQHALVLNASPFVFLKFPWILSLVRLSLWHSISLFNSTRERRLFFSQRQRSFAAFISAVFGCSCFIQFYSIPIENAADHRQHMYLSEELCFIILATFFFLFYCEIISSFIIKGQNK